MKYGIKIWSTNTQLIKSTRKHYEKGDFDYIELSAIVGSFDKRLIELLKGIPCVIHCDNKNVNLSLKLENNEKALREAVNFADELDAKYIIIHPGFKGSVNTINSYIINDTRFCIENMPGITIDTNQEMLGRTFEELKQIKCNNYCFDYSHAIKASKTLKIVSKIIIDNLIKLNPKIIHISDGFKDSEKDEHLSIGEGNFDINGFLKIIPDNVMITLETQKKNYLDLTEDIKNIKIIKKMIDSVK